jgi:hypothetical protein
LSPANSDGLQRVHAALRCIDPERQLDATLDLVVAAGLSLLGSK